MTCALNPTAWIQKCCLFHPSIWCPLLLFPRLVGSSITLFGSNLLAVAASEISISLVSSRSSVPVAANVTFYYSRSSDVVFQRRLSHLRVHIR